MHETIRSDNISPPEAESQLYKEETKSDNGSVGGASNSHPWFQLHSVTSFDQKRVARCTDVSRTSGSSKSSCSVSDDSNDIAIQENISTKSSHQWKKHKYGNEYHSDPSHDRHPSRQSSFSKDSGSIHDVSNQSLNHKFSHTDSISQRRHNRQNTASSDKRVFYSSGAHNGDQCSLAVKDAKAMRTVQYSLSSSLMIESLIDQICKMMIRDTKSQQVMYKIICNKLYEMGIISDTYSVDELQVIRNHYQKALYQIFTMGRSATQSPHQTEFLLPIPSVKIDFPMSPDLMEVSRYKAEFEELKFLAKGGFGKVYRVRHRLDGAFYAVKKIIFRNDEQIMKSVREVKMLANLNHPNVVSYKAAWIEPVTPRETDSASSTSTRSTGTGSDTNISSNCFKLDVPSVHHSECPDSEDIIFAHSSGDAVECGAGDSFRGAANPRITKQTSPNEPGDNLQRSVVQSKSVLSSSVSNAVQPYRSSTFSKRIRNRRENLVVLYVQMQLCELTLRQWLDTRNNSTELDVVQNIPSGLNLFQQIVRGVEYIHAQKVVHHDIKPSNVFVSSDLSLVQVGDFGLSCWFRPQLKHGCNIGTALYAAPEQLRGECDPKSDIYSLGIILVEILVPFSTTMERIQTIEKLRKKGQVPDQLEVAGPVAANLVRKLIQQNSILRPTASELLKELQVIEQFKCVGHCLDDKTKLIKEISAKYEAVIESKDKEIIELRKRLKELEKFQRTIDGFDTLP